MKEIKTYRELTIDERIKTFEDYNRLCEEDDYLVPFESFEEYDKEQKLLDMDFNENTLKCLG